MNILKIFISDVLVGRNAKVQHFSISTNIYFLTFEKKISLSFNVRSLTMLNPETPFNKHKVVSYVTNLKI